MEIGSVKTSWRLEKTQYGIRVATLGLEIKNWMSEDGPMNYIHPVVLVWDGEDVDCCVFETENQKINVQITREGDCFALVVKKDDAVVFNGKKNF